MSVIVLDTVNKKIEALMSGAPATNNPTFITSWADSPAVGFIEGNSNGALNGINPITIVAAPAVTLKRIIKKIIIFNLDTASVTITLRLNDNGAYRNIDIFNLESNKSYEWPGASGGVIAPVTSVQGMIGAVILDPDDLNDNTTAHKFTSATDISKLSGIEEGANNYVHPSSHDESILSLSDNTTNNASNSKHGFMPKLTGEPLDIVRGDGSMSELIPDDIGAVPTTRTVNSKPLSADVTLTPADVGAVPTTRTVNSKPLSADVTLNTADITDTTDKRYVTDLNKTVINNTSGTNTGDASTPAETTQTIGSMIAGANTKATPVDADIIGLVDSESGNILRKLTWANIIYQLHLFQWDANQIKGATFPGLSDIDDQKYPKYVRALNAFVMTTISGGGGGSAFEIDVDGGLMPKTTIEIDALWEYDINNDLMPKV